MDVDEGSGAPRRRSSILIDLPGHGHSGATRWESLEDSAAAVSDIVKKRCLQGAHLAALSLGSYVGLCAMAQNPTLFNSAVLSGIHAGNMQRRWLMYVMSAALAPLATRPFMARKTASMFGVGPAEIEDFVKSATRTKASAYRRATNDVVAFEIPASARQIRTPVPFATGGKEHALILDTLDTFEKRPAAWISCDDRRWRAWLACKETRDFCVPASRQHCHNGKSKLATALLSKMELGSCDGCVGFCQRHRVIATCRSAPSLPPMMTH